MAGQAGTGAEDGCRCPDQGEIQPGPCEGSEGRLPARVAEHGHDGHDHGEHDHEHEHDHDHGHLSASAEREQDRGRLLVTLLLTLGMMVAEVVGGLLSGSLALLSDAGHMLTDAAALLLALLAVWLASRPADLKRTFGFFRMEVLSALLNGVTLLVMSGFIAYEAWQRLLDPQPIRAGLMLAVAVAGLAVNVVGLSMLSHSHSLNVRGAFLHLVGDALSSVGVIVAGGVAWLTGWTLLDPIVSLGIAVVIVVGAIGLVRRAVHVLLEAVPEHIDLVDVYGAMKGVSGVSAVHDLHVWTISHRMHALSAHLVVDDGVGDRDQVLAAARDVLRVRFGIDHSTLQIESESFARRGEAH